MRAVTNIARLTFLFTGLLTFGIVAAQDTDALAKAAQNPISSLISLPFQWNSNFEVGPLNKPQHVLNIQPVNLQVSFYYNVERPDQAPEYQIRLQIQLMFPK